VLAHREILLAHKGGLAVGGVAHSAENWKMAVCR
jgi:hypothetical protein